MIAAAYSSFKDMILPADLVIFGEIGLAGEVRPVPHGEERLKEAAKHGFTRAIIPIANKPKNEIAGMEVIGVSKIGELMDHL